MRNTERDVARSLPTHKLIIQSKFDASWVSSVTDQGHFKPVLSNQGSAQHCYGSTSNVEYFIDRFFLGYEKLPGSLSRKKGLETLPWAARSV
jgi:hypothetical protein